jgi:hypothetical protein
MAETTEPQTECDRAAKAEAPFSLPSGGTGGIRTCKDRGRRRVPRSRQESSPGACTPDNAAMASAEGSSAALLSRYCDQLIGSCARTHVRSTKHIGRIFATDKSLSYLLNRRHKLSSEIVRRSGGRVVAEHLALANRAVPSIRGVATILSENKREARVDSVNPNLPPVRLGRSTPPRQVHATRARSFNDGTISDGSRLLLTE